MQDLFSFDRNTGNGIQGLRFNFLIFVHFCGRQVEVGLKTIYPLYSLTGIPSVAQVEVMGQPSE